MKGTMWCRLGYVCCAFAGCLAGYGLFVLSGADEIKPNTVTKENTLVRKVEDSVFFVEEKEAQITVTPSEVTIMPSATPEPERIILPTEIPPEPQELQKTELPQVDMPSDQEEKLPSLAAQWGKAGFIIPTPFPDIVVSEQEKEPEPPVAEVITYPAKIFGQTPVINRTDAYVSYFEFAYDLIAMMEPEVTARGQNMNVLLTKFAVKALLCGVDIEQLDINAPIPRRLAALCLWLAAQVLNESGCDTSSKSAQKYVTDISGCSASEKKAIAYLYEQGIVKGYQASGQQFSPNAGLKTGQGADWLSGAKQCWN